MRQSTLLGGIGHAMVIAPHPDDEILGCGGTMSRLAAAGCEITVVLMTRGTPPRFDVRDIETVQAEAKAAHARIGVTRLYWLDFPAAELDRIPHADINRELGTLVRAARPDALFIPFLGDVHMDHQLVFLSSLVAARPRDGAAPSLILAYETLSETNWNAPYLTPSFVPNMFVDISGHLAAKLEAFSCYRSQVQPFPSERSVEALEALAKLRGATVARPAAEAFVLVRSVG